MRWILLLAAALWPTASQAQELKCAIQQTDVCEAGGCKSLPANVWHLVDATRGTYARCDASRCNKYSAQFSQFGAYTNIGVTEMGWSAKMTVNGSRFHEVATLGHTIFVSLGSCKPNAEAMTGPRSDDRPG